MSSTNRCGIVVEKSRQSLSTELVFILYTVKGDTLNLVDISMIFHITLSSCQLLVQLDIDISTRFKVSLFTV